MANNRETITDHFTEDLREGGLEEEKEKVDSDSEGLPPIIPVDEEEEEEQDGPPTIHGDLEPRI